MLIGEKVTAEGHVMECYGQEKQTHQEVSYRQVFDVERVGSVFFADDKPTNDHKQVPSNTHRAHDPNTRKKCMFGNERNEL